MTITGIDYSDENGLRIAQSWYDAQPFPKFSEHHIDTTWPAPGSIYVWCMAFIDLDYEFSALLRVDQTCGDGSEHIEVVDLLVIVQFAHAPMAKELQVVWRQAPRLFFDQDGQWLTEGYHFLADTDHRLRDANRASRPSDPELEVVNAKTKAERQQKATAAGVILPYMRTP